MPILINPVQPPFLMPPPDGQEYNGGLAPAAYRQVVLTQHDGAQATFDIFPDGEDNQGLRVTLARGSGRNGVESNGYAMTFTAGASSAGIDDPDNEVQLTFPDASALSLVKSTVDAVAGLSSVYFGGETGSSTIADFDTLDDVQGGGGTADRAALVRVQATHGVLVHVGTAAPANDAGVRYISPGQGEKLVFVPAGDRVWLKRQGSTNAAGSAEIWVIEGGG